MYSIKEKEQISLILEPLNLKEEEKNSLIAYLDYVRISVSSIVKHADALLKINSYFSENRYHRNSINTILAKAVLQYVGANKIIEIDKAFKEYDYSSREREIIETTFYRVFHKNPEMLRKDLLLYSDFNLKSEIISNPYRMKHQITSLYAKYRYLDDKNVCRRVIVGHIFNSDEMFCYEFSIPKENLFEKYPLPARYKISEEVSEIYTAREKKLLNLFFLKMGLTIQNVADLINKLESQGVQYEQIKEHLEDIKTIIEHFKLQGYKQADINTIVSKTTTTSASTLIEIDNLFDENSYSLEEKKNIEITQTSILGEIKEEVKGKLELYNLENLKSTVINNPVILTQPLDLSYARIMYIKSRKLSVAKYSNLLFSEEKRFKERFGADDTYVKRRYPINKKGEKK